MAMIPMIPVGPVTTLNRSILCTERRMSGTGGDDFICGHCGYVILENFDPSTVRGNPVYQCAICENNNDLPFAGATGDTGPIDGPPSPGDTFRKASFTLRHNGRVSDIYFKMVRMYQQ